MSSTAKYGGQAERWTEHAYADAAHYLRRRAELIVSLGPSLEPGDAVLDLACGDAGLADPLLGAGMSYIGVDLSEPMVVSAARRLRGRGVIQLGDLNDFHPAHPVAATTCFRAIYYARDRLAFFRHVREFTERKLVFDLNPRQFSLEDVRIDLERAGFTGLELQPFFVPQTRAPSRPLRGVLETIERNGPLAGLLLRFRFTYLCAAST